jgi:hypothetical protein
MTGSGKELSSIVELPLLIGAVDGKHVVLQRSRNSGSEYCN